jgi:RHS repeat-associated protein
VSSRQVYNPWGVQLSGPALENGWLGLQQRVSDPTLGLVGMGARTYDPTLGSFLSEDPILGHLGLGQSLNRQAYVWGDPLGLYDLDGRDVCGFVGGAPAIGGLLSDGCQGVESGAAWTGGAAYDAGDWAVNQYVSASDWYLQAQRDVNAGIGQSIDDATGWLGDRALAAYKLAGNNQGACREGAGIAGTWGAIGAVYYGLGPIGAAAVTAGAGLLGCEGAAGINQEIKDALGPHGV